LHPYKRLLALGFGGGGVALMGHDPSLSQTQFIHKYRGADKSLARPGRKQARNHVRDARDFNNIETRAVVKFVFLQGKAPKEIDAILTETVACFLPGGAKNLSAPLYYYY
jgi:hypothetical protein